MHRVSTGVGGKGQLRVPRLAYQVVQDEGLVLPQRPIMNFTGGGITATDDAGNNRTNVNVPLGAGVNMPINPDDDNKIAYALAGNFQYTLNLRTDGTSITSVARTTVGTGAAMTISAQDALVAGAGTNIGAALTVSAGDAANGVAANNGGDLNLTSGAGTTTNGTLNLQTGNATRMTLDPTGQQFAFAATVTAPVWQQADRVGGAGAPITGYPMIFRAQYVGIANPGFLNTGGSLEVSSGGAINSAGSDATSGAATFKSGDVSGSGAGNDIISGHVYVTSGAATGAGGVGTATSGNLYLGAGVASGAATNTQGSVIFTSPVSLGSANLYWQATVATPTLWQLDSVTAAGAPIVGYPMVYHAQDVLQNNAGFLNTGGSLTVRAGNALNAGGGGTSQGGDLNLGAGGGSTAHGAIALQINAITRASFYLVGATPSLLWAAAATGAAIGHLTRTTVGTGAALTISAQGAAIPGGVNTGGALNVYGGDATANLTNNATGGATTIRAGNATCGGGAGSVATGGALYLDSGSASGGITNTVGVVEIRVGGVAGTGINVSTPQITIYKASTVFNQSSTLFGQPFVGGGTGYSMTIRGSDVSAGAGANTGGAFTSRGGTATGVAGQLATGGALTSNAGDAAGVGTTSTGGAATFRGGDVTGVSTVASVGGSCTVRAGNATGGAGTNTGGDLTLGSGSGATANGAVNLQVGGSTKLSLLAGGNDINVLAQTFTAGSSTAAPLWGQGTTGTAAATGVGFTLFAQSCSGTGATTGGTMTVRAGNVTGAGTTITSGAATFQAGDVSGAFTVAGVGGATTVRGGNVTNVAAKNSTGGKLTLNGGDCTGAVAAGTCQGGHVLMRGGIATATSGTLYQGNIAFHADPASWESMEKGIFVGEATTIPTGNATAGVFIYVEGGAGKGRGTTSGTITTFIAAEPHCQRCGCDFAVEWENPKYGGKHSLCMKCLVDALERHGVSPDEYVIERAAA